MKLNINREWTEHKNGGSSDCKYSIGNIPFSVFVSAVFFSVILLQTLFQ